MAASYMVKIPSASAARGLGTGQVDQQIKFLASKDVGATHFDFNISTLVIGRPAGGGRDTTAEIDLSFSHSVWRKLAISGEIYGDTRLNDSVPGFTSTLWALTYNLAPRLVVDAGMDTAVTPNAPFRKRFVMGFVYSIGELYPGLRRRHESKACSRSLMMILFGNTRWNDTNPRRLWEAVETFPQGGNDA